MAIKCQWNGKPYNTIRELANELGKSPQLVKRWIDNGYTCDDDIQERGQPKRVYWRGKWYDSMSDAARATGTTRQNVSKQQKQRNITP